MLCCTTLIVLYTQSYCAFCTALYCAACPGYPLTCACTVLCCAVWSALGVHSPGCTARFTFAVSTGLFLESCIVLVSIGGFLYPRTIYFDGNPHRLVSTRQRYGMLNLNHLTRVARTPRGKLTKFLLTPYVFRSFLFFLDGDRVDLAVHSSYRCRLRRQHSGNMAY